MAAPVLLKAAVLLAVAALATGTRLSPGPDEYSFEEYVRDFGKIYDDAREYGIRKAIFNEKAAAVAAHNRAADRGEVTWYEAVNTFSDWTESELASIKGYDRALGYHRLGEHAARCSGLENCAKVSTPRGESYVSAFSVLEQSDSQGGQAKAVDWREKDVLTAVKDQGQCGSCWSFSAVEALEAAYALSDDGHLMNLSEQQVLDCTPNPQECGGTGGCQGGTAEIAYDRIQELGGLAGEWIYPYVSYMGKDFKCQFEQSMLSGPSSFMGNMTYMKMPSNKYEPLMSAVSKGPVAVSVDASAWSSYSGGVFDGCNQDSPVIDHGVVLVGYGSDEKLGDYWIIRNSWGAEWGENGYMRLRRTASEQTRCGVDESPSEGIACKGDPPTQKVCGTCGILLDPVLPIV